MQNKKGFTLIELMIVVAIIAILAMVAVPMYSRYIERSRNTAAQTLLQQIALAQVANQTEVVAAGGSSAANPEFLAVTAVGDTAAVNTLMRHGFRPDPNVGFFVSLASNNEVGFVAFACHKAKGAQTFVYNNVSGTGVKAWSAADTYPVATALATSLFIFKLDPTNATPTLDATVQTLTIDANGKSTGNVA